MAAGYIILQGVRIPLKSNDPSCITHSHSQLPLTSESHGDFCVERSWACYLIISVSLRVLTSYDFLLPYPKLMVFLIFSFFSQLCRRVWR